MNQSTQTIIQSYFTALSQRNLDDILLLIDENIDWYVPGNNILAPWLGRRSSKDEVAEFYTLLWAAAEPISADVERFVVQDDFAIISGKFSSKMLETGKIIDSLFFIDITVKNGFISKYTLLEDSNALVEALTL